MIIAITVCSNHSDPTGVVDPFTVTTPREILAIVRQGKRRGAEGKELPYIFYHNIQLLCPTLK